MFEFLEQGGPLMWVIFGLGALSALIFLERFFNYHRARLDSTAFLQGIYNLVENKSNSEAITICEESPGPEARIVREAVMHMSEDPDDIWKHIEEAALQEIPRLERRLGLLGALCRMIPLVGLMGTVWGLMQAAGVMEAEAPLVQSGDMAGGLYMALTTTLLALGVAAPLYIGHEFLLSRTGMIVEDMERTATEIYNFIVRRKKRLKNMGARVQETTPA